MLRSALRRSCLHKPLLPCETHPVLRRFSLHHNVSQSTAATPKSPEEDGDHEAQRQHSHANAQPHNLPDRDSSVSIPSTFITSSPFHHSLPTFFRYAKRVGLSQTSNVYIGTHYEYTCKAALTRFGFSLLRVGGADDAGIDLLGTWSLPTLPHPIRVLVQCKFRRSKPSPDLVRELEGAFAGAPLGWRGDNAAGETVVGVLCAPGEPTKSVREAVRRSGRPLVFLRVDQGGAIRACFWNKAVEDTGLGMEVGVRYVVNEKEAVLLHEGEIWESEDQEREILNTTEPER